MSSHSNPQVELASILEEHVMSQKGHRRYRLLKFRTEVPLESNKGEKLNGGDSVCINIKNDHDAEILIHFLTPYNISGVVEKIYGMDCTQVHPSVWNFIASISDSFMKVSTLLTQEVTFLDKIPEFEHKTPIKAMRSKLQSILTEAELETLSNIGLYDIVTELFESDVDNTTIQKNSKTIQKILELQSLLPTKNSAYTIAQCDECSFTLMISEQPKVVLRPSIGIRKGTDVVVYPRNSRGWYRLNIGDSITLTSRSKKKLSNLPSVKTQHKKLLICVTGVGAVVLFDLVERYQELVSDQSSIIVRIGVNSEFGNVINNRLDELKGKNVNVKVILSSKDGRLVDYLSKYESSLLEEYVSGKSFTVVTCGHPDMDRELLDLLESKGFEMNEENYRSGTSNRNKRLLYTYSRY